MGVQQKEEVRDYRKRRIAARTTVQNDVEKLRRDLQENTGEEKQRLVSPSLHLMVCSIILNLLQVSRLAQRSQGCQQEAFQGEGRHSRRYLLSLSGPTGEDNQGLHPHAAELQIIVQETYEQWPEGTLLSLQHPVMYAPPVFLDTFSS